MNENLGGCLASMDATALACQRYQNMLWFKTVLLLSKDNGADVCSAHGKTESTSRIVGCTCVCQL